MRKKTTTTTCCFDIKKEDNVSKGQQSETWVNMKQMKLGGQG